ncbi:MAG: DUF6441 family protein [Sphingomonadales bacterium]|nr:DUF6441 family protein [Sphingomonadales bacterium]
METPNSVQVIARGHLKIAGRAIFLGLDDAGGVLAQGWKASMVSAGLGRLAKAPRKKSFDDPGLDAASLVYAKGAARTVGALVAHGRGARITPKRVRAGGQGFLAIPTDAAPRRGVDGRRLTPRNFPVGRFGPLKPIKTRAGRLFLIVEARISPKTGRTLGTRRPRLKSGRVASRVSSVVMFTLVPVANLPRRFDMDGQARAAQIIAPRLIDAHAVVLLAKAR